MGSALMRIVCYLQRVTEPAPPKLTKWVIFVCCVVRQKFTKFSTWFTADVSSHPNRAGTLNVYIGVIDAAPAALDTRVLSRSVLILLDHSNAF